MAFPLEMQSVSAVVVGGVLWKVTPQRSFSFSQVTPLHWPGQTHSSSEGQLRDYLYWFSNSCQGGGKDYSATSLELLAEWEHKHPIKGFIQ